MAKDESVKAIDKSHKRKAAQPPAAGADGGPPASKIAEVDLYLKVVCNEEKEAKERDADEDAKLYIQTCKDISSLLIEIASAKINPTDNTSVDVNEKETQVTVKIMLLKKLNRLEKMRMKECRDTLQKYREQVDRDHLHLQNLVYENLHLSKEVSKCYDFKSVDEDMALVSVEEFYATAPKSISKEEKTKNNPHELKLARLSWELTQRKELAAKLKQLEVSKETITKDIDAKKEHLSNLTPHLKAILESTKPLQTLLNIPVDKTRKMHELALLLPKPLYILFVQADAFSQLAKWLSVSIIGKPEEVRVQEHHYDNISSADSDSDNEGEPQRRRKQTQDRSKSSGKSAAEAAEVRKEECMKRHPLTVKLALTLPGGAAVSLEFQWLLVLDVVCVLATISGTESAGIAAADLLASTSLLSSIYPGDTGSECPNPAAVYHLKRSELSSFPSDIAGLGVPYRWAQTLCGLDFLSEVASASVAICQHNLESTLRVIRDRLRSRIALAKEVKLLESGEALRAHNLQASVTSFSAVTLSDLQRVPSGCRLVEDGIADNAHLVYRAALDVCGVKMAAHIALPPTYPAVLPIFVLEVVQKRNLSSLNNDHVRDVERELNTSDELEAEGDVLLQKMHQLLLCSEVLAATELSPDRAVKATFFRAAMGRKRSHPYRYTPAAGGIFTHR